MTANVLGGRSDGADLYGPREVLNELRYRADTELERARIRYVHRGAPGDRRWVAGADVLEVDPSFITVNVDGEATRVPHHRVDRIDYDGEPAWERDPEGGVVVH